MSTRPRSRAERGSTDGLGLGDQGGRGADVHLLQAAFREPEVPDQLFLVHLVPEGAVAVVRARDKLDAYELVAETGRDPGAVRRIEPLPSAGPRAVLLCGLDFGVPVGPRRDA